MPAPPLTHHDILALVEPFMRSGRHVDLAATDRIERRVVFKPVDRAGTSPGEPVLREVLTLQCRGSDSFRLTRTLTHPGGLQATLQAEGESAAELLAQIDAVSPGRQMPVADGQLIARDYVLHPAAGVAASERSPGRLVLTRGVVQVDGLTLTLTIPEARGVAADLAVVATHEDLALPQDLLAVLGWNWARLIRGKDGWKSKLRLRGDTARRTSKAEEELDRVALHLARTLAEAPGRFHDRHVAARRWVVFRRAIPLLMPLCLIVTILLLPRFDTGSSPGLWLLLYHVPTLLIALSFGLQELPQFEIPPWPRRSAAPDWRAVPAPMIPAAAVSPGPGGATSSAGSIPEPLRGLGWVPSSRSLTRPGAIPAIGASRQRRLTQRMNTISVKPRPSA